MTPRLTRREMIRGSVAMAALAFAQHPLSAFGVAEPEDPGTLLPFLDLQPPGKMIRWEQLKTWITPNDQVFAVSHYGVPKVETAGWNLDISGLVKKPRMFTVDELKARRRKTMTATLECSGNGSSPGFMGAIGNVRWTGTPLGPLLRECGLKEKGIEVVFFGADTKVEEIRKKEYLQNFARSLSLQDALKENVLVAYEMNGEPLAKDHGAPLRLIVPGWFGIAWVKWLQRIEILDRRYMSKYMAREYVTIRGEERTGKTIWRETSVGPIDVKSVIARVVRLKDGSVRLTGAAWTDGTPLAKVEVQVDGGAWKPVRLEKKPVAPNAWTFWTFEWKNPEAGEHTLVSRAIDAEERVQPSPDDPTIKLKPTYWEANQQLARRVRV